MSTNNLAPMLLSQTWQLAALSLAVLVAARVFARDRPHLAHALWIVVLLKCLAPPVWTSPTGLFCWVQSHFERGGFNNETARPAIVDPANSAFTVKFSDPAFGPIPVTATGAMTTSAIDDSAASQEAFRQRLGVWLVWTWLGGAALTLTISLCRLAVFLVRLRRSKLRDDAQLSATVDRLCAMLKVGRRVRLRITDSRIGPAVVGLFRPLVLLPEVIVAGKSPADLEPILAHELIHVRRGDLWLGMWQLLARSVWWFHPLVWSAMARLAREAERCCDEEVVSGLRCEPARYARGLLDVLERKRWLRPAPAFPGVRPVDVTSKRLERIMSLGQGSRRRTPWWCWLTLAALGIVTLPGGARVAAQVDADEPVVKQPESKKTAVKRAETKTTVAPMTRSSIGNVRIDAKSLCFTLGMENGRKPWAIGAEECEALGASTNGADFLRKGRVRLSKGVMIDTGVLRAVCSSADVDFDNRVVSLNGLVEIEQVKTVARADHALLKADLIQLWGNCELTQLATDGKVYRARASELDWKLPTANGEAQVVRAHRVTLKTDGGEIRANLLQVRVDGSGSPTVSDVLAKEAKWPPVLVTKVYPVSDMLTPSPEAFRMQCVNAGGVLSAAVSASDKPQDNLQLLVDCILSTVEPKSWEKAGGSGMVQPFVPNQCLAITQTLENHEKVADLVTRIRNWQKLQVLLEVELVRLDDIAANRDIVKRLNALQAKAAEKGNSAASADADAKAIRRHLREESVKNRVAVSPRILVLDGQCADVNIALDLSGPKSMRLKLQPIVSADKNSIQVRADLSLQVADNTKQMETTVKATDGETVILEFPSGIPILSDIPYINRLYHSPTGLPAASRLILMLTPKIQGNRI